MKLVNWGKYCKNDEPCLQGTTLALHTALGESDADVGFFINRFPSCLSKMFLSIHEPQADITKFVPQSRYGETRQPVYIFSPKIAWVTFPNHKNMNVEYKYIFTSQFGKYLCEK